MRKRTWLGRLTVVAVVAAVVGVGAAPAPSQDLIKVKIARLAFPSLTTMMVDVVKDQKLDVKHGIDLETPSYGAVSAYYAALATGEVI